jgi:hypothetical protein
LLDGIRGYITLVLPKYLKELGNKIVNGLAWQSKGRDEHPVFIYG